MGILSSFKNQIGRDTGKVFSNLVWGDKHASVFRMARSRYNANKESEEEQEQFQREVLEQKIDKAQESVERNVKKIIALKIPQKKEEIIELLQDLTIMLIANPWQSITKDENKITNRYPDTILIKYEHALMTLRNKFPKEMEIIYFQDQFVKLKKARSSKKYSEIVLFVIIFIVVFGIMGVMAYNENLEKVGKPGLFDKFKTFFN